MLARELIVIFKRNLHVFVREVFSALQEYYFARKFGVPYVSGLFVRKEGKSAYADSEGYGGSAFVHFRKAFDRLSITPEDVVVDLGCGRGRVVVSAALWKPKKVIGVEMVKEFADQARNAAWRVSSKLQVPVEIRCEDAALAELDEGTVYYLYHPFGVFTLYAVLGNIRRGLAARPRQIRIIYYNPVHEAVITNAGWLVKTGELTSKSFIGTVTISIFENARTRASDGAGDRQRYASDADAVTDAIVGGKELPAL